MYLAAEIHFYLFLFFGTIQLILGIVSLKSGVRFHQYVLRRLRAPNTEFPGLVTVIVPCRGLEDGLEANLNSVMSQSRGGFEAIFVVDSIDDPAAQVVRRVIAGAPHARLLIAGKAQSTGQKVHNLIEAVKSADKNTKAFVFADSDACTSGSWLEHILSPLNSSEIACSSGYRWFVQNRGGFATHLRSAWNASIASALGPDTGSNFCWGGSTAIRKSVFEELDILIHWEGTVSDDFALSNAVKNSDYNIHFEPKCFLPTIGDCGVGELFEFTTRQMKITRTYSTGHFRISLIGSGLFVLTILLGAIALLFSSGLYLEIAAGLLGLIWMLGTSRALLRVNTVSRCISGHVGAFKRQYFSHGVLWPVSTFLFLFNDIAALLSRTITWRGITYELVSEREIRIINK